MQNNQSPIRYRNGVRERLHEICRRVYDGKQRSMAIACGLTESALSSYMTGVRNPKIESLKLIADASGVDAEWLIGAASIDVSIANSSGAVVANNSGDITTNSDSGEAMKIIAAQLELIRTQQRQLDDLQNIKATLQTLCQKLAIDVQA